ncbi:MAG: NAD-binding protein [Acidobacteriota bacterium]
MKFFSSEFAYFARDRGGRKNLGLLGRFLGILAGLILSYSVAFHYLMAWEGNDYSWITGLYWTLTVMSTLGFGDITFTTDLGMVFSILVLLTGIVFMLVLLPFTFIEFFYAPWVEAQNQARARRKLPLNWRNHVLFTHLDPVSEALMQRLERYRIRYALLVADLAEALRLHDQGYEVMVGNLDDPDTYRAAQVEHASLVAATSKDEANTNAAFTVRDVSESVPIVVTANDSASVDVLELAGASEVLQLGRRMGEALARRVVGNDALAHPLGSFDNLIIAEASIAETPMSGGTLAEANLVERFGLAPIGLWQGGELHEAHADSQLTDETVILLAGSQAQLNRYNEAFRGYHLSFDPVVILGGGRVGRAAGAALARRGVDYRIVEKRKERIYDPQRTIHGNAAELEVLKQAGIDTARTAVITTHDDDTNVYLTLYCRRLRPDLQILSRAKLERNVSTLHRAGADFVLSYASMGASFLFNRLQQNRVLMIAEGVSLVEFEVPEDLTGQSLTQCAIRKRTGLSVVAVRSDGVVDPHPNPDEPLAPGKQLLLLGNEEAERNFLKQFRG